MIRILLCAVLFTMMLLAAPHVAAEERSDTDILREIKETLWPRAYAEQDIDLLDTLLADEFQLVDDGGHRTTKADEIAWLRENPPSYDKLVFSIKRLDIFGNDSAVVGGEGTITGTDNDGPYLVRYQSTNVLIKRDGRWQAVASHVSGIEKENRGNE